MKFHLKNCKNIFEKFIFRLFYEVHCWPIFLLIRLVFFFQDLIFYCTKKVPKTTINFVTVVTGSELTSWCLLRPWFNRWNATRTGKLTTIVDLTDLFNKSLDPPNAKGCMDRPFITALLPHCNVLYILHSVHIPTTINT